MITLYLDLDGTLLDVRERLYAVHGEALRQLHKSPFLSLEKYLSLKRKKAPEAKILQPLALAPPELEQYRTFRLELLEQPLYLKKDTLFPWSKDILQQLHQKCSLILVTKRRFPERLRLQLRQLEIEGLFQAILVGNSKADLLRQHHRQEPLDLKQTYLIGDTEEEIMAGKEVGLKTIAVLSGLRERALLEPFHPDAIMETLAELPLMLETDDKTLLH